MTVREDTPTNYSHFNQLLKEGGKEESGIKTVIQTIYQVHANVQINSQVAEIQQVSSKVCAAFKNNSHFLFPQLQRQHPFGMLG